MPLRRNWRRAILKRLSLKRLIASFRYRRAQLRASLWNSGLRLNQGLGRDDEMAAFLRRRLWMMNRSYQPTEAVARDNLQGLDPLLARIATSASVDPKELLPYLCLEDRRERAEVNGLLADAYFQAQTPQSLRQAAEFMKRAWLLSGFAFELLPLYVKIFSALQDIPSLREGYKRAGLAAGRRGDIFEAIKCFDNWQWANHGYTSLDKYEYDFDILACMDELAAPHRKPAVRRANSDNNDKIRLAYLLRGVLEENSNLIQISLVFAQYHNKSRFDVTFFTAESEEKIAGSPQGEEYLSLFESFGYEVITAPHLDRPADSLLALADRIRDFAPDILIISAALADFSQYFITTLRPAPIVMGLVQGPPQQFAPPALDWCIAWSRHPLMDCPVNTSWVEIKLDYPTEDLGKSHSRKSLNLPDEACVLISGGRHTKFQSPEFWQAIGELLAQHEDTYYLAVGVKDEQIEFLDSVLPLQVRPRVRCLGWRNDFLNILPAADILIDTYPNGGGQVIVQAMALGIPLVAHRNDYMKLFDQTEWSPVGDFIEDPELVVPRGDFAQFKTVLSRLIEDEDFRRRKGELCRAEHLRHADPSVAIRGCEEVYDRVLKLFSHRPSISDLAT